MPNPFERTSIADAQTELARERGFISSLEEAETFFVPHGVIRDESGLRGPWRCRRQGLFIDVYMSPSRGTMLVDVPLGVTISEPDAAALRACASFDEAFKYKTGTFCAMKDGNRSQWEGGAEIHLVFEQIMGSKAIDDIVEIAACQSVDSKAGFVQIAMGLGLAEATTGDDGD